MRELLSSFALALTYPMVGIAGVQHFHGGSLDTKSTSNPAAISVDYKKTIAIPVSPPIPDASLKQVQVQPPSMCTPPSKTKHSKPEFAHSYTESFEILRKYTHGILR
jgi:hypothetical protein